MNKRGEYANRPVRKFGNGRLSGGLGLLLLLPGATWAGGVVTNCTEAALRAAMTGGGTVTFACDGTITLVSTITNVSDTTLDGSGRQVTISGNGAVRVFSIATNVYFTVVNVTIADGTSLGGSAILNLGGTVNLNGVTFRSNSATMYVPNDALSPKASGGAIFNRGGTVNASNCSFARNTAYTPNPGDLSGSVEPSGGAIRNEAGLLALSACTFVGNQAVGGGGDWDGGGPNHADTARGGAIDNSGTATLDLCTLEGNSATGGHSTLVSPGVGGSSGGEGSGGAIFNEGTLTTDRTALCGNTATGEGGAIGDLDGGPGGNGGDAFGAAICNLGSLWITRSTLASNVVTGGNGGGGWGSYYPGSGGKGGSGGNGGSGLGGALRNSGAASLVNCTIAYNTGSGGPGGGGGPGSPRGPRDPAGAGGNGGGGGSGFGGVDGTCNLINCTLAWNRGNAGSGGSGGEGNPFGWPGASGAAWGGTTCSTLPNTLIASNTPAGNDSFPDPKLGPLADNGGPTLTMALLPGSPAIDAGNTSLAPPTDQRGFLRPAGSAADLGAFEYGSVMRPPSPEVSTLPATEISANSATLNGTVNPNGYPTTAWFQWGTTTNYGNLTSVTALGSGTTALPLSAPLAGSTLGITYHFRVVATNDYGLAYGSDQSFTSASLPQEFNYTIDNGTVAITGYTGPGGAVTIPSSINGLPVISIGDLAFDWCTNLTSVTIPNTVTSIGEAAFSQCWSLTSVPIGTSVTYIGDRAFQNCSGLTTVTIPTSVTNIGWGPFDYCTNLTAITVEALNSAYTSVDGVLFNKSLATLIQYPGGKAGSYTVPKSVTSIADWAFHGCFSLTEVTLPNTVTNIGWGAFEDCALTSLTIPNSVTSIANEMIADCGSLINVTIPNSVTSIGQLAFFDCPSLTGVYFQGYPPTLTGPAFDFDNNVIVYYLPGTTGWGATFGGRPTALWVQVPTIQMSPLTQTAEAGSAVRLAVKASSPLPLFYLWYLNATNLLSSSTNCGLALAGVQFSQGGTYRVVIRNVLGAITSGPAMLQVIAPVERRAVPGVKLMGQPGTSWDVVYADSLSLAPVWTRLDSVSLSSTSQYYFDLTQPLPPQRFYRAWQTADPVVLPVLDLRMVPAITVTGSIGNSVRMDAINRFGPIDAWFTLATVTLTNTSQLYFDVSAPRQPERLYRLVPSP